MRTEVKAATKIEVVSVPHDLTAYCLVPMPPLDANGDLRYDVLPEYLAGVLGVLEECNIKLEGIAALEGN